MKEKNKKLRYSDIDLENWKDYDDIQTDSLWIWDSRESKGGHKFEYHGNFIPQIPNQVFRRYTKENDIIIDWFLGSGTSAIEACNLNRRIIGVELKKELMESVKSKFSQELIDSSVRLVNADSSKPSTAEKVRKELADLGSEYAQLAMLHPPYADIIKFSKLKSDLSNCESTQDFIDKFKNVAKNAYDTLEPGRFACLVIGDKYCSSELDPLGFKCMQAMNEIGFRTKSIIVKNIEGNEKAKGKSSNLWRYRALAGGFYIFKHEYVMIFFKPE